MLRLRSALIVLLFACLCLLTTKSSYGQSAAPETAAPLRVVIAGLVHGHAYGFFNQFQKRPDLQIVGVAEANKELAGKFATRYKLGQELFFTDLEEAIKK